MVDSGITYEQSDWVFPQVQAPDGSLERERRDAAEHRRKILAAARRLFAEHAVEKVSMHQVAQAAQVGQGTLYRRFAHKGYLCMALLEENISDFQHRLLAYFAQAKMVISSIDQLDYLLSQLMYFTEENAPLLGAMVDAFSAETRRQSYQSPFYRWIREVVLVLLRRGMASGELRAQDSEYVVDVLLAPLAIDFYDYQRHALGFSQSRIAEGWRSFLLASLK